MACSVLATALACPSRPLPPPSLALMSDVPYGQRWGRTGQASDIYYAEARRLMWGEDWGHETAANEWPVGGEVRLSTDNRYYDNPPPLGRAVKPHETFVDTQVPITVEQTEFIPEFRHSRWVSVRFTSGLGCATDSWPRPSVDRPRTLWTNVVREPTAWRDHRGWSHYTNRHTQWGTLIRGPEQQQRQAEQQRRRSRSRSRN